jgi:hypothetical protein
MSGILQMFGYSRSSGATVPNAPTIGTATATGPTTATVTYTAPAYDGGATIISYTAVSSPGGITGTLSQAGSGTITVSGLTAATSYTFTVYATNSVGNSASSAASNSITTTSNYFIALGDYNHSQAAATAVRVVGSNLITTINGAAAYGGVPGLGINTNTGNSSYAVLGGSGNTIYPWSFQNNDPPGPVNFKVPNDGLVDSSGNTYAFGLQYPTVFAPIVNKTNSSGSKQWGLVWGTTQFGTFNSAQWDQSGNIMVVGNYGTGYPSNPGFYAQLSEGGSVLVSRISATVINMTGGDVDTSGNYILTGFRSSPSAFFAPWVGKYSSGGAIVWGNNYTINTQLGQLTNYGDFRCIKVIGTDIYVGGYLLDNGTEVGVIAKLSGTDGSVQWQKNYTPACGFYSVTQESDGYLYWGGQTNAGSVGIVVKTDTSGNQVWSRYVGGIRCYNARAIISGSDMYITGTYEIPNYGPYYIKVPTDGSKTGTYTVGSYTVIYGANAITPTSSSSLGTSTSTIAMNASFAASTDTFSTSSTTGQTTTVTII